MTIDEVPKRSQKRTPALAQAIMRWGKGRGDRTHVSAHKALLAGVELGGTKCVCLLGTGPDDLIEKAVIATGTDAEATLRQIENVLQEWRRRHGPYQALGLASFGPLELRGESPRFGHIASTVKAGWSGADVLGRLASSGIPTAINTDVAAAALAEGRWGAARGLEDFAYITVGTGVGVGLIVGGRPVFGCTHTELGHVRIARAAADDWPGICPFHGDCVEGLASGPAIAARTGALADRLADEHPVWDLVAHAIAQLIQALFLATAPRRVLIGGGVALGRPHLLPRVRHLLIESVNEYLNLEELTGGIADYIVVPGLGSLAGPLGALALAADLQEQGPDLEKPGRQTK
jgi:fructokinase